MNRQELLHALSDAGDGAFLLQVEADIRGLLKETAAAAAAAPPETEPPTILLKFPRLDSYHRLLIHTTARRFGLRSESEPLWDHQGRKWVYCSVGPTSAEPLLLYHDYLPGVAGRQATAAAARPCNPLLSGGFSGGASNSGEGEPGGRRGGGRGRRHLDALDGKVPSNGRGLDRRAKAGAPTSHHSADGAGQGPGAAEPGGGPSRRQVAPSVPALHPLQEGSPVAPTLVDPCCGSSNSDGPAKVGAPPQTAGTGGAASSPLPQRRRRGRGTFTYAPRGAADAPQAAISCGAEVAEMAPNGCGGPPDAVRGRNASGGRSANGAVHGEEEDEFGGVLEAGVRDRLAEVEFGARVVPSLLYRGAVASCNLQPPLPVPCGQCEVAATSDHILEVTSRGEEQGLDEARLAQEFPHAAAFRQVAGSVWLALFPSPESAYTHLSDGTGKLATAAAAGAARRAELYFVRTLEESGPATLAACGWPAAPSRPRERTAADVAPGGTHVRLFERALGRRRQ